MDGEFDQQDMQRMADFQELLLEFRAVPRAIHIPGSGQLDQNNDWSGLWENDAEHSYFMIQMSRFLAAKLDPSLDLDLVAQMAADHDFVEVFAKDTPRWDREGRKTKAEREQAALERLESEWPDFQTLTKSIHEYEHQQTKEAKFVKALDKLIAPLVVLIGKGSFWHHWHITWEMQQAMFEEYKPIIEEVPSLIPLLESMYRYLEQHPEFFYQPPE